MRKNKILSTIIIGLLCLSMFAVIFPQGLAAPLPEISVTTTTDKISAKPGDVVTYTFEVTNTGAGTLFGATVSGTLTGLAEKQSESKRTNDKLESGETWVFTDTYTVEPGDSDPLENTATATAYTRKNVAYTATDVYNVYLYGITGDILPEILTSPNQEPNGGWYGSSVAVGQGLIVVGAPYESLPNPLYDPTLRKQTQPSQIYAAGRVYVYSATTGALLETLTSPTPTSPGWFGASVAVGNGVIVIGAAKETSGSVSSAGKAYIFDADPLSTTPIATLTSDHPVSNGDGQGYGVSVVVGDGIVAVGSSAETVGSSTLAGRVYLYDLAGNDLEFSPIQSPTPQYPGRFGWSVAVGDGIIVVGAPYEFGDGIEGAGNVYVYTEAGVLTDTQSSLNPEYAGHFGFSVAIAPGKVVIGAFDETVDTNEEAGRAYIYSKATKTIVDTLTSQNSQEHGLFGNSVAVNTEVIVVGAIAENSGATYPDAGNAYIFNAANGDYVDTLTNFSPADWTDFGWSVAVGSGIIVVGAYDAVFIFE